MYNVHNCSGNIALLTCCPAVGYFPEQAAAAFPDNVGSASINYTIDWDDYHKTAFLEWLDGTTPVNSEGNLTEVPTLMGGNFQAGLLLYLI